MNPTYLKAVDEQLALLFRCIQNEDARKKLLAQGIGWGRDKDNTDYATKHMIENLDKCIPYYVSPDISHLIEDSLGSYPDHATLRQDLITEPYGYLLLDGAHWELGHQNPWSSMTFQFGGFMWTPMMQGLLFIWFGRGGQKNRNLKDSTYKKYMEKADNDLHPNGVIYWEWDKEYAATEYDYEALKEKGSTLEYRWLDASPPYHRSLEVPTEEWIEWQKTLDNTARKMILSVLDFMSQKITVLSKGGLPRAYQRREELQSDMVRIVQLRARKYVGEKSEEGEPVAWSHRWIVRGHWKNQWYPKEQVHKRIFLAPFVKGPEGLPVKARTDLFAVVR